MNKYKIIALCGKAGSGKDTILKKVLDAEHPNLHEIISCTSRPPREGEVDGKNYHFLTTADFAKKIVKGEMIESTCFNDWFYGTGFQSLDKNKINIGVFNPAGIEKLDKLHNVECWVYYIETCPKERLLRQLMRESNPNVYEIVRRFHTDENDFSAMNFTYDILVNETAGDLREAARQILGRVDELSIKKN